MLSAIKWMKIKPGFYFGSLLLLAACGSGKPPALALQGETMGTIYSVKLSTPPVGLDSKPLQAQIDAILDRITQQMSTYQADSELSRFNQNPSTDWIEVSPALFTVVQEAQRISALSGGAFDITVGPLVNLWGFGPGPHLDKVPAAAEIAAAKARVGYQKLSLQAQPPALRKAQPDLYLDLSGIAEGYAADQIAEHLMQLGIQDYLVDIGGEMRLKGHNAEGALWRIAVEKPVTDQRAVQQVLQISDAGLATSGDYRNYFEQDGRRYSHTIDPQTGAPIAHALASVTVIHPNSMTADALATALNVLGPEAAYALAVRENLAVYLLSKAEQGFSTQSSPAFDRYLATP